VRPRQGVLPAAAGVLLPTAPMPLPPECALLPARRPARAPPGPLPRRAAVYWAHADLPRELVVRPAGEGEGEWHWSGSFPIPETEWYFGLRIRNRGSRRLFLNIPANVTVGPSGAQALPSAGPPGCRLSLLQGPSWAQTCLLQSPFPPGPLFCRLRVYPRPSLLHYPLPMPSLLQIPAWLQALPKAAARAACPTDCPRAPTALAGAVQVTLKSPGSMAPYRLENLCKDVVLYFIQVSTAQHSTAEHSRGRRVHGIGRVEAWVWMGTCVLGRSAPLHRPPTPDISPFPPAPDPGAAGLPLWRAAVCRPAGAW
jgi:hypothetical protein